MIDAPNDELAAEVVAAWFAGEPETEHEQRLAAGAAGDGREVVRFSRFLTVRGKPGQPARLPRLWSAMRAHPGWVAWFGGWTFCAHDSASGTLPIEDLPNGLADQVWRCDSCGWLYRSVTDPDTGLTRQEAVIS